jgi:hypothetical protein
MPLTFRLTKGSALTLQELDDNFSYFTGSQSITGSLVVSDAITSSLFGTSSWAENALTASYALNAGEVATGSLLVTASVNLNEITFTKGNGDAFTITVDTGSGGGGGSTDTGSLMLTGSVANNILTFTKGDGTTFSLTVDTGSASGGSTDTGSLLTTASISDATVTFTKGDASTFDIEINNVSSSISSSFATTASYIESVTSASYASTSSYVENVVSSSYALTASYAENAGGTTILTGSVGNLQQVTDSGSITTNAITADSFTGSLLGTASWADNVISASYALTASYVESVTSASYASTASFVTTAQTASYIDAANIDGTVTSASYALTSSYVENVVSSSYALTASYALNAGEVATGSLLTTASVSLNTITFTKGDETTFNITVDTGSGGGSSTNTGSLLTTASISDATVTFTKGDASTFDIEINNVSSSISSSYASTSSYVESVTSASYASTASYVATAQTASYFDYPLYWDNIPVNELANSTWAYKNVSRGITSTPDDGTFSPSTTIISIAASSSTNINYLAEFSSSVAGDGIIVSDGKDLIRYTISSFTTSSSGTFDSYATSSLTSSFSPLLDSQVWLGVTPVYLENVNKFVVFSGSTLFSETGSVEFYDSSNPTTPTLIIPQSGSPYSNRINLEYGTIPISGGYFAGTSYIPGGSATKYAIFDPTGSVHDTGSAYYNTFAPIRDAVAYGDSTLLYLSKLMNSRTSIGFYKVNESTMELTGNLITGSDINSSGLSGSFGNVNLAFMPQADAVYDEINNQFYVLCLSGSVDNYRAVIAELSSSATVVDSYGLQATTSSLYTASVFNNPDGEYGPGIVNYGYQSQMMALDTSREKIYILDRGRDDRIVTPRAWKILSFDYSNGIENGTWDVAASGSFNTHFSYYSSSVSTICYSPVNDVIVISETYAANSSRLLVIDPSNFSTIQTESDTVFGAFALDTNTGNIVFSNDAQDQIDASLLNKGQWNVLTPNASDSATFQFTLSQYSGDPSTTITPTLGDSLRVKYQAKTPVVTSPNNTKFRLNISNDGVVTGSAI